MTRRLVDAYGDDYPAETYINDDGTVVDTYGDPVPVELWEVDE